MHKYYRYYQDLDKVEKAVFWVVLFSVLYLTWQIAVRPFWNN